MSKFAHQKVLDNGLNYIKSNCDKITMIFSYDLGESYASVVAKIAAEATMTSADFTLGSSGYDRTLTSAAGKSDPAANATGGSATNHIAFLNTTGSEVLWVTEETSGQVVTLGNPVNFPSLVYSSKQPTE